MPKRNWDGEQDGELKRIKGQEQLSQDDSNNQPNHQSIKNESSSDNESDNDEQPIEDSKARHDSLRKMQHQKSDKQRRAKIKEGMDQLKTLVSLHGKLESPDQASIVAASIDLVHSLRNEIVSLKQQIDVAHQHNAQQRLAIQQFQARMSQLQPMYNQPSYPQIPNNFNDPMEQTVIQRSNSLLNNCGGNVSNAQFAQLASQIQQLRGGFSNNTQASPPNQSSPGFPSPDFPSPAQMAQITSLLHSGGGAELNSLLASVAQSNQFMPRGSSQSAPLPSHNGHTMTRGISQSAPPPSHNGHIGNNGGTPQPHSHHPNHHQQPPSWD